MPPPGARIAVIGAGIAGLGAAWLLARRYRVVLLEAQDRLGGHSNTVDVPCGGHTIPVDTGFIVYNETCYPLLTALFRHLGVESQPSGMSFSVSLGNGAFEYAGGNGLRGLFAGPTNALSPRFLLMLRDIARFFRLARAALSQGVDPSLTLGDYLARSGLGPAFRDRHLLPMVAAIWSASATDALNAPAAGVLRFFDQHGLLRLRGRPQWRTVKGGSRSYVRRMADNLPATVRTGSPVRAVRRVGAALTVRLTDGSALSTDAVVIATHADQARALLAAEHGEEAALLGAFRYRRSRALLHGDARLMPRRRAAWASWNVLEAAPDRAVSVTYWMNRLQAIDPRWPLFVTLNPPDVDRSAMSYHSVVYDHPQFDARALLAQRRLADLNGRHGLWFCGSYLGHGFHEDALASAVVVARAFDVEPPWSTADAR
jgi:predicted NAD/FAD-binding protein